MEMRTILNAIHFRFYKSLLTRILVVHAMLLDIAVTSLGINRCSNLRFCSRLLLLTIFILLHWNYKDHAPLLPLKFVDFGTSPVQQFIFYNILTSRKIIALTIAILSRGLTRLSSHRVDLSCMSKIECVAGKIIQASLTL